MPPGQVKVCKRSCTHVLGEGIGSGCRQCGEGCSWKVSRKGIGHAFCTGVWHTARRGVHDQLEWDLQRVHGKGPNCQSDEVGQMTPNGKLLANHSGWEFPKEATDISFATNEPATGKS